MCKQKEPQPQTPPSTPGYTYRFRIEIWKPKQEKWEKFCDSFTLTQTLRITRIRELKGDRMRVWDHKMRVCAETQPDRPFCLVYADWLATGKTNGQVTLPTVGSQPKPKPEPVVDVRDYLTKAAAMKLANQHLAREYGPRRRLAAKYGKWLRGSWSFRLSDGGTLMPPHNMVNVDFKTGKCVANIDPPAAPVPPPKAEAPNFGICARVGCEARVKGRGSPFCSDRCVALQVAQNKAPDLPPAVPIDFQIEEKNPGPAPKCLNETCDQPADTNAKGHLYWYCSRRCYNTVQKRASRARIRARNAASG